MSYHRIDTPGNVKSSGYNVNDPFKWPPQKKKKVIIASVAGGSAFLITGIIAILMAGALALGTLGLVADSPIVILNAQRIIKPDAYNNPNRPVVPSEIKNLIFYDNSSAYPTPGNQGKQKSCVGWASAYALKSAQEKNDHNWDYNVDPAFSPAFIYNQINHGKDEGSLISEAMRLIVNQGTCLLSDMPYNDKDFKTQPNKAQMSNAYPHIAKDWFTISGVEQIKLAIVKYGGVVVGINIYSDFDDLNEKNPIFDVRSGKNRGGHAICLVGYDDEKNAFKFINSWGIEWGLDGFGWVLYDIVEQDTKVYGAFCMTDVNEGGNIE